MAYSYTKARQKQLLSPELKLVLFFFGVTLFMLAATYSFLLYKTYDFKNQIQNFSQQRLDLNRTTAQMNTQIAFIEKEFEHSETIYTNNTILKESIKNLFDLVPDRITLSKAQLDQNTLVLYGITPNKEVYEFMLQAPLRSIFHRTYSSFYPIQNGWYRFVSTNYLDQEKE